MLQELMERIVQKEVIASVNTAQKLVKLDPTDKKSSYNCKRVDVCCSADRPLK